MIEYRDTTLAYKRLKAYYRRNEEIINFPNKVGDDTTLLDLEEGERVVSIRYLKFSMKLFISNRHIFINKGNVVRKHKLGNLIGVALASRRFKFVPHNILILYFRNKTTVLLETYRIQEVLFLRSEIRAITDAMILNWEGKNFRLPGARSGFNLPPTPLKRDIDDPVD